MPLPVYVINLDRRPDRWKEISLNLEQIGVKSERVPAVNAEQLVKEEWAAHVDPAREVNLGSIACALSHAKVIEKFLDSGNQACLILEDDAEVATDTASLLHSTDWWPKGADIIRLEDTGGGKSTILLSGVLGRTPGGRNLRRLEYRAYGTAAYLINREGAEIVLEALKAPDQPADHILFNLRFSKTARKIHTFQVIPAMARQRYGYADTDLAFWRQERGNNVLKYKKSRLMRKLRSVPYRVRCSVLKVSRKLHMIPVFYQESF